MNKIQSAVDWAVNIANDNTHGYEWGGWGPDYDCGHLIIDAWQQAGVPVKTSGASHTGSMRGPFLRCGFEDVTGQIDLNTGAGLQAGDVLINYAYHAAMAIGGGRIVQARTNADGVPGDSSGQEIRTQAYYNHNPPWDCVLRYTKDEPMQMDPAQPDPPPSGRRLLYFGLRGDDVRELQELLIRAGYSCGPAGADGAFGMATHNALIDFQRDHGIGQDGVAGPITLQELRQAPAEKQETQEPQGPRQHTVVRGDTLWKLAAQYCGSGLRYKSIAQANNLSWPYIIMPGMVLTIPEKEEEKK